MPALPTTYYAVTYREPHENKIVTLRARTVEDSELGLGFICIRDFVFERSGPVVNPTEEAMASRFEKVKRLHLHLYAILSIEEIGEENEGLTFENDRSKLIVLERPSKDS